MGYIRRFELKLLNRCNVATLLLHYVDAMFVQAITIGNRQLQVTIIALPSFISARGSTAKWVLTFSVLSVVATSFAFAVIVYFRNTSVTKQALMEEHHKKRMLEATKAAHEKTIAYACHQLRYGQWRRDSEGVRGCIDDPTPSHRI